MKLSDYFIGKIPMDKAVKSHLWFGVLDRVTHKGTAHFYDIPDNVNAEDFAAAVAVAFDVDVDPRDVVVAAAYRIDL